MNSTEGTITSVAFKMANNSNVSRNFSIYMINTEKDSFSNTMDWVNLSQDDMVFNGSVSYPGSDGEWFSINLQTPFEYTGGNILLCVYDMTGIFVDYGDDARFYTYSTGSTPRSLNKASLQYTYDVTDMSEALSSVLRTALCAACNTSCIKSTTNNVISNTWKVLNTTTTNKHD